MFYELFIGLRYLRAKRRQAFISMITWISIGGVAIGVLTLIVVLAVMTGFEIDIRDKILGITSHIVVQKFGGSGIEKYEDILKTASGFKGIVSAAPFIQGQVMITAGKGGSAGVIIHGVDPEREGSVTNFAKNIAEGDIKSLKRTESQGTALDGIFAGKELYKNLGLYKGQEITVISPLGRMTPGGMMPKMKKFKVAGRFDSGMYEYDSNLVFISLEAAQRFLNMKGSVTGIEVKVDDIYKAGIIGAKIQEKLQFPFYARSWMEMNKNLFSALQRERIVMFMILALIILVAAFNIASTLIMVVMEKSKEIAVLKAMGSTNKSIITIFTIEGIIIGFIGNLLGFLSGTTIVRFLGDIELFIEKVFNTKVFPGDVYYMDKLPAHIEYTDIALILSSAMFICLVSTLYPAWKASRIDPSEALRYE